MNRFIKSTITILFLVGILTGCNGRTTDEKPLNNDTGTSVPDETSLNQNDDSNTEIQDTNTDKNIQIDLSAYFEGINGCAVIYDNNKKEYSIYNQELAEKRSSPCSTFKIVSTLIGLESKVIGSERSVIAWNGTKYPIDEWNHDLTLQEAFQCSCVWYFRNVIDQAGKENTDKILSDLVYGNCDISQWEGNNANSDYNELNGFWLESSLVISPKEQVDILIKIFGKKSDIEFSYIDILKGIMMVENDDYTAKVYGKTGTGYKEDNCVDAWFVGFTEKENNKYYFAIRLDEPKNKTVSGLKAKEIAFNIINNYLP